MKLSRIIKCTTIYSILGISLLSCKKYLETKSDQTLSTPETLDDLQAILDNPLINNNPILLTNTGTDEYYLKYTDWQSRADPQKKGHIWAADVDDLTDWNNQYKNVLMANTALYSLPSISKNESTEKANNVKGIALFTRANAFFQLAQLFAPQFDPATATTDNGIVLRLSPDFNIPSVRATVEGTYQQILLDLNEAATLLPPLSLYKNRPGKAACYGLLAKVYLQMSDFQKAYENADKTLKIKDSLINFNKLSVSAAFPMGDYMSNDEILYLTRTSLPLNADAARAKIDSTLYKSFAEGDLRKKAFFKQNTDGSFAFKGNYTGTSLLFNGIAIDELYLIRAECNARLNNTIQAMNDLNALLVKRWVTGMFVPLTATTPKEALDKILVERKKELIDRGVRWSDLRRLNKETQYAITLTRNMNGTVYILPPNDLRYTLLIPRDIIARSGIPQNKR
jgi:tetratricopeptide (TPR) repeat protein